MRRRLAQTAGIALVAALAACSGPALKNVEIDARELPTELLSKFEVRESAPATSGVPVASAGKGKAKPRAAAPARQAYQIPNRRPAKDPLWPGETAVYEVTYFGVAAGTFTVRILPHAVING